MIGVCQFAAGGIERTRAFSSLNFSGVVFELVFWLLEMQLRLSIPHGTMWGDCGTITMLAMSISMWVGGIWFMFCHAKC